MLIDFLEAASGAALSKTHEADANGTITTKPYPLVKNFNSYRENVTNISEMSNAMQHHASLGRCALKGVLTEELSGEERRGKTNPTDSTQWICLDLDFDTGFADIKDFIRCLGPDFQDVSYIFQHSNSAGFKGVTGLRGHLYFLLASRASPGALKEWLKEVNFTTHALANQLILAKNGHSLIWPLDISTCQNYKLIFISPPTLINLSAQVTQYFDLVVLGNDTSSFIPSPNPSKNKADLQDKISELRKQMGLKVNAGKYKPYGDDEILVNPDPMIISETQDQGDYVRCNIVGDNPSWGYYYEKHRPDVLRNFKGHPLVKLRDIDPGFYQGIARQKATTARSNVPVIFRDLVTDEYYNGIYESANDTVAIHATGSKAKLEDFLINHDIPMPEAVPDWSYTFDPTTLKVIDFTDQWANKFIPTSYLKATTTCPTTTVPPNINLILRSITVDQQTYEHLLNWLAYIFQTRKKAKTAWLFSGIEGTGKGLFIDKILSPIFGERYVARITAENLEDLFNARFEEAIFLFVDEFNIQESRQLERLNNKIKNLITEERISIRRMRTNEYEVNSFLNLVLATNAGTAVPLSQTDRRFNIAPPQNKRLEITDLQVETIESELEEFSTFLRSFAVDSLQARSVLKNQARQDLMNKSMTSIDLFFHAIKTGHIEYFLENIDHSSNTSFEIGAEAYKTLIKDWCEKGITFIPRDELQQAYSYLQNQKISATKFSRMCTYHDLQSQRKRVDGLITKGYDTNFPKINMDDYFKAQKTTNKVVKIK